MSDPVRGLFKALASLKLTVAMLAMLMVLVFAGTWAQIDMGIWSTLKIYFRSLYVMIPLQVFLPRDWNVPGAIPFPGGYLLGAVLTVNLLAAHTMRFGFTRRRIGMMLIHFGLILLIAGELVTGMTAEEANMTIEEGETVNFAEDTREIELAIIDRSPADHDRVFAISQSALVHERRIEHPELPFAVKVDHFYPNSELFRSSDLPFQSVPRADRGTAVSRDLVAVERPVASGVEQKAMDLPAALVTLEVDGKSIGTWLVALYFDLASDLGERLDAPQGTTIGGRTFDLVMRHKRIYKPYSIELIDFRHDRYLGTDTPRNFSSQVRLVDPTRNEDREVLIYMNNPLRYEGETFYQASFKRGDTATILQVVRNPGWLLPYIACTIGGLGMLIHFGMNLMRFLKRSRA